MVQIEKSFQMLKSQTICKTSIPFYENCKELQLFTLSLHSYAHISQFFFLFFIALVKIA